MRLTRDAGSIRIYNKGLVLDIVGQEKGYQIETNNYRGESITLLAMGNLMSI